VRYLWGDLLQTGEEVLLLLSDSEESPEPRGCPSAAGGRLKDCFGRGIIPQGTNKEVALPQVNKGIS
jgi:hypothetical protein